MQSVNDIYKGKQACFGTVTRNHLLVIIIDNSSGVNAYT